MEYALDDGQKDQGSSYWKTEPNDIGGHAGQMDEAMCFIYKEGVVQIKSLAGVPSWTLSLQI